MAPHPAPHFYMQWQSRPLAIQGGQLSLNDQIHAETKIGRERPSHSLRENLRQDRRSISTTSRLAKSPTVIKEPCNGNCCRDISVFFDCVEGAVVFCRINNENLAVSVAVALLEGEIRKKGWQSSNISQWVIQTILPIQFSNLQS